MENKCIYTVGHSTHQLDYFLELISFYGVNCIVDVRSVPASKYNPQYNQNILCEFLEEHEILYKNFSKEFGARKTENFLLDNQGYVDFEKVRNTHEFLDALNEIENLVQNGCVIALMCSESEPFDCHRFSMISYSLCKKNYEVKHILKDKKCILNHELEQKLLKTYTTKVHPNFFCPEDLNKTELDVAYKLRNKDIAYSPFEKEKEEEL